MLVISCTGQVKKEQKEALAMQDGNDVKHPLQYYIASTNVTESKTNSSSVMNDGSLFVNDDS
jgi:hypothetical protein